MKVFLYILDTMADWEIGFLTAELASGRFFKKGNSPVEIVRVGASLSPVTSMGGWRLTPDVAFDDVAQGVMKSAAQGAAQGAMIHDDDLLVLPGATTWLAEAQRGVLLHAKERIARGGRVAAICDATTGLASVGALDEIPHTSNGKGYLSMMCPSYRGEARYVDEPAVTAGNLITASGLAPVEFAREAFAMLDVFPPKALDAWYGLYTLREERFMYELLGAVGAAPS